MWSDSREESHPWFAVWTRSRHEHVVWQQLTDKGIEAFLPTVTRWSRRTDRKKKLQWPLFPGYCFARFDPVKTLPILTCAGVVRIISSDGRPAPIADAELTSLRVLVDLDLKYDPCPLIPQGALIEVLRGPLQGVRGRLLRKNVRHATVVMAVTTIGQAVRVDVDASDIALAT